MINCNLQIPFRNDRAKGDRYSDCRGDGSNAVATADARGNDPGDGNYRLSEGAAAGEGLAAAEHCGAAHCSCCKARLRSRRHAASGHGPGIPD
jgi:hypothetical protein